MKTALLFPGQGSQRVGMGREIAWSYPIARQTFEEADEVLGWSLSRVCFEGPEDALVRTELTQPAILTTSIAVLRALRAEVEVPVDVVAGHSLGEWSALVAAGALRFADAVRLVHLRGRAMQEAVPAGQGAMAALIGLEPAEVEALCAEVRRDEVCAVANLNGGGQVVVSGHAGAVERVMAAAEGRGAARVVRLQVSAPFHCPLMAPAAAAVRDALGTVELGPLAMPVVANVTGELVFEPAEVKGLLVEQITAPVRWEASVRRMAQLEVGRALEIGAGTVLKGLVRRIARQVKVTSVGEVGELRAVAAGWSGGELGGMVGG